MVKVKTVKKENIYNGVEFDSQEEIMFYIWLVEAELNGFIFPKSVVYHPDPFLLQDKISAPSLKRMKIKNKIVMKHLLHPITYQADFKVTFTKKFQDTFINHGLYFPAKKNKGKIVEDLCVYFDVKGGVGANLNRNNSSAYTFMPKIKWLWNKYNIYINKLVPKKYFSKTFCPELLYYCKNRKVATVRSAFKRCKLLKDIIK